MKLRFSRASKRAMTIVSMLGTAVAGALLVGGAFAQPAAPLVNPPGVSISRAPLNTDPSTWVGCSHVAKGGPAGVPGMLCAPSIQTGTPAIQAQLTAQRDAYLAANPPPAPGTPNPAAAAAAAAATAPVVCGPNPYVTAAPAPAGGRGPARMPQNGRGPIRVAFITQGHEYEREQLAQMLDCLGDDIKSSHI